ncbi:DivIVA domain-containing protein [Oerskovia jenensis]|uniref:DivIVA domain-containing protein n=1 Tax=Oerskovia jenensis TaxID=162169 RepID=A0ABS2LF14_9CELL|nr:DivIVA domain-containing protein [Oerskovia jenensis]MBM7479010.1 DivIVA domain-containing protein [Oerskovia jenensis]
MLTAQQVLNTTFSATKFREGYDVEQVDDYLDRVTATLTAYEAGDRPGTGLLTSAEARSVRFSATKWREGYDVTEVDDLIDGIVGTLASYEAGPAQAPSTPPPTGAANVAVGQQDSPGAPEPTAGTGAGGKPLGIHDLTTQLQYARIRANGSDRLVVLLPDGTTASVTALDAGPHGITLRTAPQA